MAPTMFMTSYPLYMMSHTLFLWQHKLYIGLETHSICHHIYYISLHPLCRRHHTNCVRHHRCRCMPSCALHMTPYPPCKATTLTIHDITCTICDMSSTVYDVTFTICVTSHNAYISDIPHSMFMTYPLFMASHTVLWQHNHCVISQSLCLTSQPLYLCHHTQWINFIKHSVCMTS